MFGRKTLAADLDALIKKITKTGRDAQILLHRVFDNANRQELEMAQKLKDDINARPVIYTDADFILARNPRNAIGKLMANHKNSLPQQFVAQRKLVTDVHLDGVIRGTEKEYRMPVNYK